MTQALDSLTPGELSHEFRKANIRQCFLDASASEKVRGLAWYQEANTFAKGLAKKHNLTLEQVAGIIAACSPQRIWEKNREDAKAICAGKKGRIVGLLFRSQVNAGRILLGEPVLSVLTPRAPKSRAFFANILNPKDSKDVTVDRHAVQLATGARLTSNLVKKLLGNAKRYEAFALAYRQVAEELDVLPSALQAVTWTHWTVENARTVSKAIRALRGALEA